MSVSFSTMRPLAWLAVMACVMLAAALDARAQEVQVDPAAQRLLVPEAKEQATLTDPSLTFRTEARAAGRIDAETGVRRVAYRVRRAVPTGLAPEAAARAYLRAEAEAYGWPESTDDLDLVRVQASPYSSHVTFRQTVRGVPVHGRVVKVNLDRGGQPTFVVSGYAPHLPDADFDVVPRLDAATAQARVEALVTQGTVRVRAPELVVYPSDPARLAWRMIAWPSEAPAEWEVLLDAHTGEVIQIVNQAAHASAMSAAAPFSTERAATLLDAPMVNAEAVPAARAVDGLGYVFDPDPLTTSGQPYGGAYVDNDDADSNALNNERIDVVLRDITQGTDGLYRLAGPYVNISGVRITGNASYTPPAVVSLDAFRYLRSDQHFEAVMAYYHIDKSQRYVQTLNLGRGIQDLSLTVNPHDYGSDDRSGYFASINAISFGDGAIDDGEDADVIWHEYGHALLEGDAPGLRNSGEGQALHEGWSDYWAVSYHRALFDSGEVPEGDWRMVFPWDGNNPPGWCGRRLDHEGTYPDDVDHDPPAECTASLGFIYELGVLWATTLMEIQDDLGRYVTDRLVVQSHAYLAPPVLMTDAAEALVQADRDLYDGAHLREIVGRLGARGFLDSSAYGPVLAHEPLRDTEQLSGNRAVEVEATGIAADVRLVTLYYQSGSAGFQPVALGATGGGRYAGSLSLTGDPAQFTYYIEAVDELGNTTRLPADAPNTTYQFEAGPDTEAPQVTHTPPENVGLAAWPFTVVATVTDNTVVDSVWVQYRIEQSDGSPRTDGVFPLALAGATYRGVFPVPTGAIEAGDVAYYRFRARDRATTPNETLTDEFAVPITSEGVLVTLDFEADNQAIVASGAWARGVPTYGLAVARSGEAAWGTVLDGAYPESRGLSSLTLPPVDLSATAEAYLIFWHWYDTEYGDNRTARLYDGGNVKVSTDGGATWAVAEPDGGYPDLLNASAENPLGGEPGFGAYSYGWQRVLVPLPTAADVRVRFDFGTDAGNVDDTRFEYAGWFIDDVTITTRRPVDTEAPTAPNAATGSTTYRTPSQAAIPIDVEVFDNTGIAQAEVRFAVNFTGNAYEDVRRLEMDPAEVTRYQGAIQPIVAPRPGDHLTYRIHVTDFEGNEATFPPLSASPFQIDYRQVQSVDVLADVRATGAWRRFNGAWSASPGVDDAATRSALVLTPIEVPANADIAQLLLTQRYNLAVAQGGNVKISTDGGTTWRVLRPERGVYDGTLESSAHPMDGEDVFSGSVGTPALVTFDLSDYVGKQIRLRFDLATAEPLALGHFWTLDDVTFFSTAAADAFDTPRTFALHPSFPNPFSTTTTVSYTLPEAANVELEVYDALGRRLAVLVYDEQEAGTHTVTFDGSTLANGVYLLRLRANRQQRIGSVVLFR